MFASALHATGSYSPAEISLFEREVKARHFRKDEILLRQGDIATSIFFNLKGAIYQYSIQLPDEKNIIDLHVVNEWFFNQHSFATQSPSTSFIAAYTDSTVLELSIESIHYLINCSQAFFQLNTLLARPGEKNYFFDNMLSPLEKYQYIVDKKGGLLQAFPLKMIASYLKITPETLSRVREKLSRPTNIS